MTTTTKRRRVPAFTDGALTIVATPEELTERRAWWGAEGNTTPNGGAAFAGQSLDRFDMVYKREMESTRPGYWLRPVKSPREEALAQIKAAEKRQADGLVRPFSAAQYKRWSADPRPRPATYYDGSLRPDAGSYPQGSVDYVSLYREANNARGQLVRGAREPVKVRGKRKVATA